MPIHYNPPPYIILPPVAAVHCEVGILPTLDDLQYFGDADFEKLPIDVLEFRPHLKSILLAKKLNTVMKVADYYFGTNKEQDDYFVVMSRLLYLRGGGLRPDYRAKLDSIREAIELVHPYYPLTQSYSSLREAGYSAVNWMRAEVLELSSKTQAAFRRRNLRTLEQVVAVVKRDPGYLPTAALVETKDALFELGFIQK